MEEFFKWLANHSVIANILVIFVGLVVVAVVTIFVLAFVQGRDVGFWPPKIGPRQLAPKVSGWVEYQRFSRDISKNRRINDAKEVWLIGATMHYTLSNSKGMLLEKIISGTNVYLLVADPQGDNFQATAHSFGQTKSDLTLEARQTLTACQNLKEQLVSAGIAKGSLSVKLLDHVFKAGAYFFDPRANNATAILVPHVPSREPSEVPGFVLKETPEKILDHYFELYSALWNKGVPFEEWQIKHQKFFS